MRWLSNSLDGEFSLKALVDALRYRCPKVFERSLTLSGLGSTDSGVRLPALRFTSGISSIERDQLDDLFTEGGFLGEGVLAGFVQEVVPGLGVGG